MGSSAFVNFRWARKEFISQSVLLQASPAPVESGARPEQGRSTAGISTKSRWLSRLAGGFWAWRGWFGSGQNLGYDAGGELIGKPFIAAIVRKN